LIYNKTPLKLGEIDFTKKVINPIIYLCKPNKEIISIINESYNIVYSKKLGSLNELVFRIPNTIEKFHTMAMNDNATMIRGRYLLKLRLGNYEEYFIVSTVSKTFDISEEFLEVKAFSLGYELNDKIIRGLEVTSKTATELLNLLLVDTIWNIGYIDSEFDLKMRGLNVSSSTVLELVFQVAETFNALVVWDSLKREINFFRPDTVGEDKGFSIKYGKYLESLNQEDNSEEVITRLKVYGEEDLTIRSVNPTGTTYIEDFSYFLAPYKEERDYSETAISSLNIKNDWTIDDTSLVSVNGDILELNSNVISNKIISSLKFKKYEFMFELKGVSQGDGISAIVRYIDENNYIKVTWDNGYLNPVLNALIIKRDGLVTQMKDLEKSLVKAETELFELKTEELTLQDDISVYQTLQGKYEAIIISEEARGRDTTELKVKVENLKAKILEAQAKVPVNKANITSKESEITQLKANLELKKEEIKVAESEIEDEKKKDIPSKLKIVEVRDGVQSVVAESDTLDGWSDNVKYKVSVSLINRLVVVKIDDRLALEYEDKSLDFKEENTNFGILNSKASLDIENVVIKKRDFEVLERSDYMSVELSHYILAYLDLQDELREEFKSILDKKEAYNGILLVKNNELNQLQNQLKILLDERDIINTRIAQKNDQINHADNALSETSNLEGDLRTLTNNLNIKLMEIKAKEAEIKIKETEIIAVRDNLNHEDFLMNLLSVKLDVNNFFPKRIADERNQFVIEKEWSDSNITEAKDLLEEGLKVFEDYKKQKITLSIGVVNFLAMITEQRNWDKLNMGDTFKIEQDRLNIDYKAKLIEAEFRFEDAEIDIKITNVQDLYSTKDKFLEMLYSSHSSSVTLEKDKWKWDLSLENKGSINQIINGKWDANKQAIIGAKDQVVEISDRGLLIRDPNNPNDYLVGLNSMIAITNDGGQTWKHAITSTGIVGERIYGKVIMGVNLAIEDEHGIVKWQGSKGEIFDRNGNLVMKMGLVSEPPESKGECFGLVSFNDVTRVSVTDCVGFAIEQKHDGDWRKVLWANTDGTLYSYGVVAKNIKIINNVDELIMDAENNIFNLGLFEEIVADGKLTTLEKLQLVTELYSIHSDYKLLLAQAGEYMRVHADDIIDMEGEFKVHPELDPNKKTLPTEPSIVDRYSTTPLADAYANLINYMSNYIKVVEKGIGANPLEIDIKDKLTESTSEIPDRAEFIGKFKAYYDEATKLRNEIQDTLFTSSINMGEYYNNMVLGKHGLVVMRNDGKYRAYLNATNGLALQKWEGNKWVNKVYASIGNSEYADGTLIAEDLVAKRLRIETSHGKVLLDADSLNLDFTVLNAIVYDDIIMSPEKSTMLNQFKVITEQKNKLKEQISRYVNTIYNDRDNSYFGLDTARTRLLDAEVFLDASYDKLKAKLDIVFTDMNEKTVISTDLKMTKEAFLELWKQFYANYELVRSRLEDFLEKSSLQLGRNYNNTVIDAENGVTVTRGDIKTRTRLNATQGIEIARNDGTALSPVWTPVFWVDTTGYLFAKDITTHGLHIVDGDLGERITFHYYDGITIYGYNGATIYLNANDAIKIDMNGDTKFRVDVESGGLYAKDITTHNLKIVDGFLGEKIIFDHDKGITINGNNGEQIRLNANEGIAIDVDGEKRIWIGNDGYIYGKKLVIIGDDSEDLIKDVDGSYISDLTVNSLKTLGRQNSMQDIIHIEKNFMRFNTWYSNNEKTKLEFTYEGSGDTSYPVMILGAGNGRSYGSGSEKAKIYKDNKKFAIEYDAPNGVMTKFYFNESDSDDEGQAVYFESKGGVRFHSDKKFVAKTDLYEFFRVVKGQDAKMQFGQYSWISLEKDNLMIRFDTNNYIKISSSGVEIKGSKISLN